MAKEKSIREELWELKIGLCAVFQIDRLTSVKTACSTYGLMWGRRFRTATDRDTRTVTVTRTA